MDFYFLSTVQLHFTTNQFLPYMSTNYIITLFLYIVHKKASPCSSPSPIVIRETSQLSPSPSPATRKKPSWHKTNWTSYVKGEYLPFRLN